MELTITGRYLILPINRYARRKNLAFYENGSLVYDFDAYLDTVSPQHTTYMDLSALLGKTLTVTIEPCMEFSFAFTDEIPNDSVYREPYRPTVHFSTKIGWINDPNGLIYHNGQYHLFYQHNPAGNMWDNMTWGHAVSRDLIHWEEKSDALFPDRLGTMFSGSAIADTKRITPFEQTEDGVMLLYYTAAGNNSKLSKGQPFTQCLAYSNDNGITFHKYENNPIIGHIEGANRDPKVIFCDELGTYLLALYLDGDRYAIFKSSDLIHFEEFGRLSLPGDDECPDLYPLTLEEDPTVRKWIFSGASDTYLVGDMTESGFIASDEVKPYFYGRRTSYAAQTFSGTGSRRIKIAWDVLPAPNAIFENQMGIPTEVTLTRVKDRFRLRTLPVREFEALRQEGAEYSLNSSEFKTTLFGKAFDMILTATRDSAPFNLSFLGHSFRVNTDENTLSYREVTLPLSYTDSPITLRIITDTLGCEVFLDNGLIYTVADGVSDYNLKTLTVKAKDGKAVNGTLTVHTLATIH